MRSAYVENGKKGMRFFKVVGVIFILLSILFLGYIISIDMLPIKYLGILGGVIFLITLIISLLIFKKKGSRFPNVIGIIFACFLVVGYGFVYKYLYQAFDFIDTISDSSLNTEVEEFYVIVRADSTYEKIEDLKDEDIYTLEVTENIDKVEEKVNEKVNVNFKDIDNLDTLATNLLNEKIDIILISSSQYSIILEDNEEFKDETKIIYTITQEIEKEAENVKDETSKHQIENGIFNVYISGIDTSGNIRNVSRSDANIVVTVNTKTNDILLTSIPRDYYVTLHSKNAKDKLTHSGIYGINETVNTVEDLLGIDINYYVRVNFTTVVKLVDAIGGIDVNSDYAFTALGYSFKKGTNHLNGSKALAFSRERHSFADGDVQRAKNQQKVINAIISKLTSSTTLLTQYSNILNSLSGNFQTNIEQDDISILVKEQLENMPSWNISTNTLIGTGSYNVTYSCGNQKLYVMLPNSQSVEDAKEKINEVMNEK